MKKGFTLTELLATIVVLGIILLIVLSNVGETTTIASKAAFKNSVNGIYISAENRHVDNLLKNKIPSDIGESSCGGSNYEVYKYNNGVAVGKDLNYKGKRPKSGIVTIGTKGEVAVAVHNGKWCAVKKHGDKDVKIYDITKEECDLLLEGSNVDGFVDVYANNGRVLGLHCNGTVMIGLYNDLDNMELVPGLSNIKKIYDENYYLTENNELYYLDYYEEQLTQIKIADNVKDVTATNDADSVFIIMNDGSVKVKGYNSYKMFGLGADAKDYYEEATPIPGLNNVKEIYFVEKNGSYFVYALLEDGTVKAWGYNLGGAEHEFEDYRGKYSTIPKTIPGLSEVKELLVFEYLSFAIHNNGSVSVWGYSYDCESSICQGEILTPTISPELTNIKTLTGYRSNSKFTGVAVQSDNTIFTWNSSDEFSKKILGKIDVKDINVSNNSIIILDKDSKLHSYGYNWDYSICPGKINTDGTFVNKLTMHEYTFDYRFANNMYSKIKLHESHSWAREGLQCMIDEANTYGLSSYTQYECFGGYEQSYLFDSILSMYDINGNYMENNDGPLSIYDCIVNAFANNQPEEALQLLRKIQLYGDDVKYSETLTCMIDNLLDDSSICFIGHPEEYQYDFMTTLFDYNCDGIHFDLTEETGGSNSYSCPQTFGTLKELPNISNINKMTGVISDVNIQVFIRNGELFSWGYYFMPN